MAGHPDRNQRAGHPDRNQRAGQPARPNNQPIPNPSNSHIRLDSASNQIPDEVAILKIALDREYKEFLWAVFALSECGEFFHVSIAVP